MHDLSTLWATLPERPVLIAFAAYALLWLLAMLHAGGYLRLARRARADAQIPPGEAPGAEGVTVVVTTHNQRIHLERMLPLVLDQEGREVEVLVADLGSDDGTAAYVETLAQAYPQLHYLALPPEARDISPQRLMLTLAFRRATHEWVALTDASCCPVSPRWLAGMMACAREDKSLVMGYTRYTGCRGWTGLRFRFFRLWQQQRVLARALHHRPYRADGTNLLYRRSAFLAHRGFAGQPPLLVGAVELLVNTHGTARNTAVCLAPQARMLQSCPNEGDVWRTERLFFMETRRHLPHRWAHLLGYAWAVCLTLLHTLGFAAVAATSLWAGQPPYPLLLAAAVLWLVHLVWRSRAFHAAARALGERPLHLALPLLLHLVPLWDTAAWLRHRNSPHNRFRKRFV